MPFAGETSASSTTSNLGLPKAWASLELLGLLRPGRAGLESTVRGRVLSVFECRRGLGWVVCGVPKIACLKARTANTGAGVSGGSR